LAGLVHPGGKSCLPAMGPLAIINVEWQKINVNEKDEATLHTQLGHINLHIRSGSIILTHAKAEYTLTETRAGAYTLIVNLDERGVAVGQAILDNGISLDC